MQGCPTGVRSAGRVYPARKANKKTIKSVAVSKIHVLGKIDTFTCFDATLSIISVAIVM